MRKQKNKYKKDVGGNMRKKPNQTEPESRRTYTGIFVRTCLVTAWSKRNICKTEDKILLKDITDVETGRILTDYLWFNLTKGFSEANPKEGDILQFNARTQELKHIKRYWGHRGKYYPPPSVNWKLSRPTKIINLSKMKRTTIPTEPTGAQSAFIKEIADTLNISYPNLTSVYEASKWIDKYIGAYQQKKQSK